MNINRVNNIQKVMSAYGANKTEKVQKPSMKEDKIEISQKGKDYQIAMDAFKMLPDVRTDKINELKSQIENGTYSIDKDKLVNSMVNGLI